MENQSVDIVLATFQGEKYIDQQIESILNQTWKDFRLFIRDDGSTDGTYALLQKWHLKDPRITLMPHDHLKMGAKKNFSELVRKTTADWVFFSDQDDIWEINKLEIFIKEFRTYAIEKTPLLFHSDLSLVDHSGHLLASSFWVYSGRKKVPKDSLNTLLVQNSVTGCAMAVNRSLINIAGEIPAEAVMHDAWYALVAAAFGKVIALETPLVRYRQHENNVIGAKSYGFLRYLTQGIKKLRIRKSTLLPGFQQAEKFLECYRSLLPINTQRVVKAYLSLSKNNYVKSRFTLFREGFYKPGTLRNICHLFTPFKL